MPVAIAPDETRMTSVPRACAAASASTMRPMRHAPSPLIEEDPTFTTTRRAARTSARVTCGHSSPSSSLRASRWVSSSARASALASMRSW